MPNKIPYLSFPLSVENRDTYPPGGHKILAKRPNDFRVDHSVEGIEYETRLKQARESTPQKPMIVAILYEKGAEKPLQLHTAQQNSAGTMTPRTAALFRNSFSENSMSNALKQKLIEVAAASE